MKVNRIVCWFSCGAASAVATKIMLQQASKLYPEASIVIANSPIIEEHPDNERFLMNASNGLGRKLLNFITLNIQKVEIQFMKFSVEGIFKRAKWRTLYDPVKANS